MKRLSLQAIKETRSIRPYQYPHSKKAEIECLIKEMLAAGIIKASTSPYSSLVLWVKKKDRSWQF